MVKVDRKYRHNNKLVQKLSKATGLSVYSIKRSAFHLCEALEVEFPSLSVQEWRRRYGEF